MKRHALIGVCLTAACSTTSAVLPVAVDGTSPFTTTAQLDQLRATPAAALPEPEAVADVSEWTLAGPLPEVASHEPHPNASPFDAHVLQVAEGQVATSADMACVAHETARFVVAKKARPPAALERFIAGRCGATAAHVETAWISGKSDGADDALAAAWAGRIDNLLITLRRGGVAGTGFAREEGEAVWAIAWSKESLELADVPLAPRDGKVRVEGKAVSETLEVSALINHGAYGVTHCAADTAVAPPKFAFDCPADAADDSEWISLEVRELDALLGAEEARVLALPKGAATTWKTRAQGPATAPSVEALLQQLNAARAKAGLGAVKLAAAESKRLDELAPRYFGAERAGDTALEQQIALGVMAGWAAGEPIAQGSFCAARVETADAKALLAELLDPPALRARLMNPSVSLVSLSTWSAGKSNGALLGAFVPLASTTPVERVRKVISELDAGRVKRSVHPVNWVVPQAQISEDQLEQLASGRGDPGSALDEMIQIARKQLKVQAHGWQLQREGLTGFPFPAELLTEQPLDVWVVVTPYRPKNHPWTEWAIFMVSLSGNLKQVVPEP